MQFTPPHLLSYYLRRYRELRRAQQYKRQGVVAQWHLLHGSCEQTALLDPQPQSLRKLIAPPDRYWADPFGWKRGNEFFIFCEEVLYREKRGHISVIPVDAQGNVLAPARKIIAEPFHLSYPFLFEFDGTLYLMPESGFASVLNLYRCIEFPYHWEKVGPVFEGLQYYDSTLFEEGGRWWLFATVRNPRRLQLPDHDLQLFSASAPIGEKWIPHPGNSIVRDFRRARPAGRIFRCQGKLYRPSQNCLDRYGGSLNINEIISLDPKNYRERLVKEVQPNGESYVGLHHLDWHDGILLMDTQRLIPESEVAYR